MSKTFSSAVSHVKPDIVVFLGDLIDEGSKASDEEYDSYMERFRAMFYPAKDLPVSGCSQYIVDNN